MTKINRLTLVALLTLMFQLSFGQKNTHADLSAISSTPEYKAAQTELDKLSLDWKAEIETKYADIDKLCTALNADAVSLTSEMKAKRENEINIKVNEAKNLLNQRFGLNGDIYKKREELIKRLQG